MLFKRKAEVDKTQYAYKLRRKSDGKYYARRSYPSYTRYTNVWVAERGRTYTRVSDLMNSIRMMSEGHKDDFSVEETYEVVKHKLVEVDTEELVVYNTLRKIGE